ncbi:MAG TPA: CHRD domain-containing protein [Chitinophagaceae bacterium]
MKQLNKLIPSFLGIVVFIINGFSANATIYPFHNSYSGGQEVPPNGSPAVGTIVGTYNDQTNTISFSIIFSGLVANTTVAHFHGPAPVGVGAGVAILHAGFPLGVTSGSYSATNVLTDAQEAQLLAGLWYSNIHTTTFPGGELRAQIQFGNPAEISVFRNLYSGSQEVPPNASPATGMIIGSYNHTTNTISFSIRFAGLTAPTTVAHFHGPAPVGVGAGVAILHAGFPLGVTSGFYSSSNVLTNTQESQLVAGLWYSNIHTSAFPGGELRAQVQLIDILPPVISDPVANPSELWPPNHKMKDVSVSYTTTDNFPGAVTCQLSVTSNEPVTGPGDNTSPDWIVGASSNNLSLRAERTGPGNGRIYTITVTCTDQQGNSSSKTTTVMVPHDQGHRLITSFEPPTEETRTSLEVFPNPSRNQFTINLTNSGNERVNIRIVVLYGRTVETKNNISGSQVVRMGNQLKAGVYYMVIQQGTAIRQLKLVKASVQ